MEVDLKCPTQKSQFIQLLTASINITQFNYIINSRNILLDFVFSNTILDVVEYYLPLPLADVHHPDLLFLRAYLRQQYIVSMVHVFRECDL